MEEKPIEKVFLDRPMDLHEKCLESTSLTYVNQWINLDQWSISIPSLLVDSPSCYSPLAGRGQSCSVGPGDATTDVSKMGYGSRSWYIDEKVLRLQKMQSSA